MSNQEPNNRNNNNNEDNEDNFIGDVVVFDRRYEKRQQRTSMSTFSSLDKSNVSYNNNGDDDDDNHSNTMPSHNDELFYSTRVFPAPPPATTTTNRSRTSINNGMELKNYLMQRRLLQGEKLIVESAGENVSRYSTSTASSTAGAEAPGSVAVNGQPGAGSGSDKGATPVKQEEEHIEYEVNVDFNTLYDNGDDEEQGFSDTPRRKQLSPLLLESLGLSESEIGSLADESCPREQQSPFDVISTTPGDWVGVRNNNSNINSSLRGGAFVVIDVHDDDGYERGDRHSSSSDVMQDEEQDRFSDELSVPSLLPMNNHNDNSNVKQKYRNWATVSNNNSGSLHRSSGTSFDSTESSTNSNVPRGQRLSYIHKKEMEELLAVVDKQIEEAQRIQWKQEMEIKAGARNDNSTAGNAMQLCAFLALMILTIVIGATTSTAPEQPFPGTNMTFNGPDETNITSSNDWMGAVVVAGGSPTTSSATTTPLPVATNPPVDSGAGVVPTSLVKPPPPSQQQQQQQQVPIIVKQNNSTTVDIVGTNVTQGDAEVPP